MFGFGRKQGRGLFSPRTGIMSALALGAAYLGTKLWKKRKGEVVGLRESHPKSSEWTPDTSTSDSSQASQSPQSSSSYSW